MDFVVKHSLISLPSGRMAFAGEIVTDLEVAEDVTRFLELGAIVPIVNEVEVAPTVTPAITDPGQSAPEGVAPVETVLPPDTTVTQ